MYRITEKHLRAQVDIVNSYLGFTTDPEKTVGFSKEPGSLSLSGAYGGWTVHRRSGNSGGASDLMGGHHPARECSRFLSGMIEALRIAQE